VPPSLRPAQAKHVLGSQGNIWGEYIPNGKHAEYMAFPRAAALAEVAWTPANLKDWKDFQSRMVSVYLRLDALGVNYRKPKENESALCEIVLSKVPRLWDLADALKARVANIYTDLTKRM